MVLGIEILKIDTNFILRTIKSLQKFCLSTSFFALRLKLAYILSAFQVYIMGPFKTFFANTQLFRVKTREFEG